MLHFAGIPLLPAADRHVTLAGLDNCIWTGCILPSLSVVEVIVCDEEACLRTVLRRKNEAGPRLRSPAGNTERGTDPLLIELCYYLGQHRCAFDSHGVEGLRIQAQSLDDRRRDLRSGCSV